MKNELMPFEHPAFGKVRVIMDESTGEPWFVAKDVAVVLGFRDAENMARMLDDDEKGTRFVSTLRGLQKMTAINEAGLYSAILRSRKSEARQFKRWITHEVLPAIRKTGGYLVAAQNESPEAIMARAVLVAQDTIKRIEAEKIAALKRAAEAERAKAHIGSKREATCMATASAAVRKAKKLEAQLAEVSSYLPVKGLRWLLRGFYHSDGLYKAVGLYLSKLSDSMGLAPRHQANPKYGFVNAYHPDVVERFRQNALNDNTLLKKYRKPNGVF